MNGKSLAPPARATAWSVTCNLKSVSRSTVDSCIDAARSLGWGVEGQLEVGEEGTEHYQLLLKTPQVRFAAVKKVFPTAHIEAARNVKALEQYVHKEETRKEEMKPIECTFATFPIVRRKFFAWLHDEGMDQYCMDHDERLEVWDRFIGISIREGMEVDLIGMNPQNRGCVAKYWKFYIAREVALRQTQDRSQENQTDTQEVNLPVYT